MKPKNHKKQLYKHKPQAITDVRATWQAGLLSINILYYDTSPIRAHFVDSARYVCAVRSMLAEKDALSTRAWAPRPRLSCLVYTHHALQPPPTRKALARRSSEYAPTSKLCVWTVEPPFDSPLLTQSSPVCRQQVPRHQE